MAVSEFTDFLRSVRSEYSDSVSDGILESNVIFKEIERSTGRPKQYGGIIGGKGGIWKDVRGDTFQWRILKDLFTVNPWGPASSITAATPNLINPASMSMGGYTLAYAVGRWEMGKLGGPTEFVPLIRLYEQMRARKWEAHWEQKILADDSSVGGWQGLATFMAQSGTYATNVDLSQSYAQPYRFNYSGSGQSFDVTALDRFREVCVNATHGDTQDGADAPNVAFCRLTDWTKVCVLIEDSFRNINVDTERFKRGFTNFTWNNVPWYWSKRMETDAIKKVYVLNTHHLGVALTKSTMVESETADAITGNFIGTVAVDFHQGQVYCSNTRKQGYLDNTDSQ